MFSKSKDRSEGRTFCGKSVADLDEAMVVIDSLQDTTVLTDEEIERLELGIQAINRIRNQMVTDKKWNLV